MEIKGLNRKEIHKNILKLKDMAEAGNLEFLKSNREIEVYKLGLMDVYRLLKKELIFTGS